MNGSLPTEVRCVCNDRQVPLCALCDDDIYCPQCGEKIVGVQSRLQRPEGRDAWVYATDGQFELPVTLMYGDRDRQRRFRQPLLKIAECTLLRTRGLFAPGVEQRSARADHEQTIRLQPSPTAGPAPVFSALPAEGLRAVLHLVGEFGTQDMDLIICRAPRLSITVTGEGVHPVKSDDAEDDQRQVLSVDVTREESRTPVTISLEATDAPIYLDDDIREYNFHGEDRRFPRAVPKGTILRVGSPLEVSFDADLQGLQEAGGKALNFWVIHASVPELIDITFQRAELGEVKFSMDAFRRDRMQFGEKFPGPGERTFWVQNVGRADLLLLPPEVRQMSGPEGAKWIQASWPGIGRHDSLLLKKGMRHDLRVELDLTRLNRELLGDSSLRATVALVDDKQRIWQMPVVINQLVEPPVFKHALCIDFGNTNSCTATRNPGGTGFPSLDADVTTLTTPAERYPTALLFADVMADPPQVLIGEQAVAAAKTHPQATLVTGLKRSIGSGASTTVWDVHGHDREFPYTELVGLYLAELIRESESRLRHQVRDVAVSYPVKFLTGQDRTRFDDFDGIVNSTASGYRRLGVVLEGQAFQVREYLDEASCVCYGFVLDKGNSPRILERLQAKAGDAVAATQTLNIASFDFGGGSIDTAILRYQLDVMGRRITRIQSHLIGSGGDATFGGDNVTVAVFECLLDRLERLLREVAELRFERLRWADPVSPGYHGSDPIERTNYQRLWEAAELLKHYLCNVEGAQQESPSVGNDSASEDARQALLEQLRALLGDLVMECRGESGSHLRSLRESDASLQLANALKEGRLLVPLEEVYAHPIAQDLRGMGGYTVAERIQACVNELRDQATQRDAPIDYLVLAGASCRVPLVADLVRKTIVSTFPGVHWEYDVRSAKSKVATGLSRYCEGRQALRVVTPDKQLPFDLGLWFPVFDDFVCLIPQFTNLDDQAWTRFAEGDFKAAMSEEERRLVIYRCFKTERGWRKEVHGYFDFATQQGDQMALPAEVPLDTQACIRLAGSAEHLELKVSISGVDVGCWRSNPADPEPS